MFDMVLIELVPFDGPFRLYRPMTTAVPKAAAKFVDDSRSSHARYPRVRGVMILFNTNITELTISKFKRTRHKTDNLQRSSIFAIMVAAKFLDDVWYSNPSYA